MTRGRGWLAVTPFPRGRGAPSTVVRTGQSCLADAGRRVRAALPPSLQAAFAAALAWLITRRVLGHTEPFFAPVAATISLGTMRVQRSQRIVQMVLGVLVGIGIGTLFGSLLGVSTPVLGLTVLAALLAGRALGAGFVGDGMMLVNQAASSAILVVTLHHGGTGAERAIDAAVGGAVALLVGVVLFPARPLPLLHAAERALLGALARALEGVASHLSAGTAAEPAWTLQTAHDVHDRLAGLTAARSFARVNVRVAPRRWRLRPLVDAEDRRLAQLHLLADAALALVRAATAALEDGQRLPSSLGRHIAALATAMGRLASARAPWPPELLGTVEEVTRRAIAEQSADRPDWPPVVASTLRTTARDLQEVTAQPVGPATTVPKGTRAAGRRRQHVAVRPRAQPEGGPPSAKAFAPHQARRYRRER